MIIDFMTLLSFNKFEIIFSAAFFGLIVGSFLNTVIYRMPKILEAEWRKQYAELSAETTASTTRFNLASPRSHCPNCQTSLRTQDLIPVISWLWLRGHCSSCTATISARYPLVEILTAVLFGITAQTFGLGWPLLAALILTSFLLALAFIDFDSHFLPDQLTLPILWIGLGLNIDLFPLSLSPLALSADSAVLGAITGYLSLWSIHHIFKLLTGKEGMGYGDFKLLAALGAWLGVWMLLPIVLIAATLGSVVGLFQITLLGKGREVPIAFGPYLAGSGWVVLIFSALWQ